MKKYVDPTVRIAYFQKENVAAAAVDSFIAPVQELINNDPDVRARLESFLEILKYQ